MTGKGGPTRSTSIGSKKEVLLRSAFAWPRVICWVRVLLAVVALARFYTGPYSPSPALYAVLGTYLAFAIALAIRSRWLKKGTFGLLALFVDAVFFLILASSGGERLLWLMSIFYLHLLTEALVFYGELEVFVVVMVSVLFCALLPYAATAALERTVVIAGAMACANAIKKKRLEAETTALDEQLKEARNASEKAAEDERQRIASDFHDGPLQSFISMQMRLEILRKLLERDFSSGLEDLKQKFLQASVKDRAVLQGDLHEIEDLLTMPFLEWKIRSLRLREARTFSTTLHERAEKLQHSPERDRRFQTVLQQCLLPTTTIYACRGCTPIEFFEKHRPAAWRLKLKERRSKVTNLVRSRHDDSRRVRVRHHHHHRRTLFSPSDVLR